MGDLVANVIVLRVKGRVKGTEAADQRTRDMSMRVSPNIWMKKKGRE